MTVFPALCSAMLRHFLDSPLKHLWINSFWCLWRDTNSFLACSLSTFLYGIMSIHVHFDYVCVCASMYGLGVCIWACAGYVLRLQHLNGGVDTYAWLWYAVSAGMVQSVDVKSFGETAILVFCVRDVYYCSQQWAGGCCCIVQLGSVILCMLEFCSSLFIGYGTIHMLFIIICLLLSVCCMLLCPVVLNFAIVICSAHSLHLYSVSCWTSLSGVSSCYILHFSICRCMCYVYVSMCPWLR